MTYMIKLQDNTIDRYFIGQKPNDKKQLKSYNITMYQNINHSLNYYIL